MKPGTLHVALIFIGVFLILALGLTLPESYDYSRFTAIETLFTGLAFAGVIITVLLQSKELALQRKVLDETRKEFQQQNETLSKQRFENTFFQLIDTYSNSIKNFGVYNSAGHMVYGLDAVRNFYQSLEKSIKHTHQQSNQLLPLNQLSIEDHLQLSTNSFALTFGNEHARSSSAIFWRTVELIHRSSQSSEDERSFYVKTLLSIVSDYELKLIFYDYFFSDSPKPPIELIVEYNLFFRIKPNSVLFKQHYDYFQNELKKANFSRKRKM